MKSGDKEKPVNSNHISTFSNDAPCISNDYSSSQHKFMSSNNRRTTRGRPISSSEHIKTLTEILKVTLPASADEFNLILAHLFCHHDSSKLIFQPEYQYWAKSTRLNWKRNYHIPRNPSPDFDIWTVATTDNQGVREIINR
jgi:hypothetical protein